MKVLRIVVVVLVIAAVWGCKKKKYPDSVTDPETVFYFKGSVDNSPVSFGAGMDDYFMYSSHRLDSNSIYNFIGHLRPISCNSNCANSVYLVIRGTKVSGAGSPSLTDSALVPRLYNFASTPVTAYQVQFQSIYNKTAASYLWDFGDGSTSTQRDPLHTYARGGNYKVCLTITGTNGCTGSICNTQKITTSASVCKTSISTNGTNGNIISFVSITTGLYPYKYFWDFGDGKHDTAAYPTHTYVIPGSYPVSLKVTDAAGNEAFSTFNTITQFDASSCTVNYKVNSITPINTTDPLNRSTIGFNWTDANGVVYSSENIAQPSDSYFQVVSVEDYHDNERGEKTKKVFVKFKCKVSNGSSIRAIDNAEAVLCVSYR